MDNQHQIYAFAGRRLLLCCEGNSLRVPRQYEVEGLDLASEVHEVVMNDGRQVWAVAVGDPESPGIPCQIPGHGTSVLQRHAKPNGTACTPTWTWVDLRQSYYCLPLDDYLAAGKASEILYWDSHSRFCPACGTPTRRSTPITKLCPACGMELYPPVATAIIVLIRRGEQALLVRARNFRGKFHGLVAGFLEPGETLEECVRREVNEETGLTIRNISYFGSQPWPYPCGLMVGFTADYAGGEIELRDGELTTAAFFSKDNLPELPQKLSIARRLIDSWIAEG